MKLLSLCVDRDDDIGRKAKIRGPIIGEKNCIEAAIKLGIKDPEDSDVNSILACIKEYKENKEIIDCVVLTGHKDRGLKADKRILRQLDYVLKKYPDVEGVVFVSDGADDEQLLPIISQRVKIASIKTVIVKQQKELEKGYYVIKEAIKDPDMAKIFLGIPGIILFLLSFGEYGFRLVLFSIGMFLIAKGFGIDKYILNLFKNFRKTTNVENNSFPLYLGASVILLLSLILAWSDYYSYLNEYYTLILISKIIISIIPLITISVILFSIARIIDYGKDIKKIKKYLFIISSSISTSISIYGLCQLIIGYFDFTMFIISLFISIVTFIAFSKLSKKIIKNVYLEDIIGKKVLNIKGKILGKILKTEDDYFILDNNKKIKINKIIKNNEVVLIE